jgi:hypothetical protein
MNWFARYSLTGSFFVGITIAWLYAFTSNNIIEAKKEDLEVIAWISAGSFLPIGYIVSSLSHFLYYKLISFPFTLIYWHMNKETIEKCGLPENLSELSLETEIASKLRLNTNDDKLERTKWYAELINKRWATITINNNFMLTLFLSPLSLLFLKIIYSFVDPVNTAMLFKPVGDLVKILCVIEIIIFIILCFYNKLIGDQLGEMFIKLWGKTDRSADKIHNC